MIWKWWRWKSWIISWRWIWFDVNISDDFGRNVGFRVDRDIVDALFIGDYWGAALKVGGEVYDRIISRDIKYKVDTKVDDSIVWDVDRDVRDKMIEKKY